MKQFWEPILTMSIGLEEMLPTNTLRASCLQLKECWRQRSR